MKMEIYGFKADVKRDGKLFVGTINELHVQDQPRACANWRASLRTQ
jgi:environmental stress-induced protein Ves